MKLMLIHVITYLISKVIKFIKSSYEYCLKQPIILLDLMKEYRKIDDNIMLKLNTTDTHSKEACANFFVELADAYQKREYAIDKCLKVCDIG